MDLEEHKMTPSPPKRPPRVILLATQIYRLLLVRFGPDDFLQEYEQEMLSDFRRHCHKVYKQQGIYGLVRECSPLFIKAIVDMSKERALSQKRALSQEKKTAEDLSPKSTIGKSQIALGWHMTKIMIRQILTGHQKDPDPLKGANFTFVDSKGNKIYGDLKEADLKEAYLKKVILEEAYLTLANIDKPIGRSFKEKKELE